MSKIKKDIFPAGSSVFRLNLNDCQRPAGADLALANSAAEVMTRWDLGQNDTITGRPISNAEAAWAEGVAISFGLLGSIKLGTYVY